METAASPPFAKVGALPLDTWRRSLDRIEQAASQIRAPPSYGSEAYTLREHIGIVRRAVEARAHEAAEAPTP